MGGGGGGGRVDAAAAGRADRGEKLAGDGQACHHPRLPCLPHPLPHPQPLHYCQHLLQKENTGLLLLRLLGGQPAPPGLLRLHLPLPPLGSKSPFVSLLPLLPREVLTALPPASRAAVGSIFLTVAALTVERFLSSTVRLTCVRATFSLLALLVAIAGPALLLAFQILTSEQEDASLTTELWFGVEVAVYIICPLLVLTVFGTVNYCKVSLTSRLLPSHQVQAVKLNIGVTVTANLAIFLFLVQECLALWLSQLEARPDPDSVAEVLSLVDAAHNLAQAGVGAALSLLPLLYLCLTASCCRPCCCPAINQLEEGEVSYTMVATDERHVDRM